MKSMKLSEFVKNYRKMKLLTQTDLAEIMDISKMIISKIERGMPVSYKTLRTLSKVMGVDSELVYQMSEEDKEGLR